MRIKTITYVALAAIIWSAGSLVSCKKIKQDEVREAVDSLKVGLIAHYQFNNSAVDSSGNGHNGTAYNVTPTTNRFNKANSAYYFDGTDAYITVPDDPALRLSGKDFTLNAWVKLDEYNSSYGSCILTKRITGANNGWTMLVNGQSATSIGNVFFGPGANLANAVSAKPVPLAQWVMLTCEYRVSTGQLIIYINGQLDSITNNFLTPNAAITSLIYIGKDDPSIPANGYFFKGSMDDLRMYNRALSNVEILKLLVLPY